MPADRSAAQPRDDSLASETTREDKALQLGRYSTIVADPPWSYQAFGATRARGASSKARPLPYDSLSITQIELLPVSDFAASDAHLYLWTTQRYLRDAFGIAESWGFRPASTLIWCKTRRAFNLGGTFQSNTEFILFCRRGNLPAIRRVESQWFDWRDSNKWAHSRKPEAFLDLVESVSPGPYLELFARRNRLGWDTWGDEALNHVELSA